MSDINSKVKTDTGDIDHVITRVKDLTGLMVSAIDVSTLLTKTKIESKAPSNDEPKLEDIELMKRLAADASQHTNRYIRETIAEVKQLMDYVNGVDGAILPKMFPPDMVDKFKSNSAEIDKTMALLVAKSKTMNERNPFYGIIAGFKDLSKAGKDSEKQFVAFQSVFTGIKGASKVIGEVGGAVDGLMKGDMSEAVSGVTQVLNDTMSMATTGMSVAGPWGAAVGGVLGLVSSIFKLRDKSKENDIKGKQKEVDNLKRAYEQLGDSINKAYSNNASNLIADQNQMLEQQKVLISGQIMDETSKKDADNERIDQWNQQIESIDRTIVKNRDNQIDAIFGEDVKAAISNFAKAYADAWASGGDRVAAVKDMVNQMIKAAIVQMIEGDFSKGVEAVREKIATALFGPLNGEEKRTGGDRKISLNEKAEIDELITATTDKAKGYSALDEYMVDKKRTESLQGGFETMSQDTGSELNGRFTALQMSGESILSQNIGQTKMLSDMLSASMGMKITTESQLQTGNELLKYAVDSYLELQNINLNTGKMAKCMTGMAQDIAEVKVNTKALL